VLPFAALPVSSAASYIPVGMQVVVTFHTLLDTSVTASVLASDSLVGKLVVEVDHIRLGMASELAVGLVVGTWKDKLTVLAVHTDLDIGAGQLVDTQLDS